MTSMRTVSIGPLFVPLALLLLGFLGWFLWRFFFARRDSEDRPR
jgi:hypothetical protein